MKNECGHDSSGNLDAAEYPDDFDDYDDTGSEEEGK